MSKADNLEFTSSSPPAIHHSQSTFMNFPPAPKKFVRKCDRTELLSNAHRFAEERELIHACRQATGRSIVEYESAKWGQPSIPFSYRRECSQAGWTPMRIEFNKYSIFTMHCPAIRNSKTMQSEIRNRTLYWNPNSQKTGQGSENGGFYGQENRKKGMIVI